MRKLIIWFGILSLLTGCSGREADGIARSQSDFETTEATKQIQRVAINGKQWAVETVSEPKEMLLGLSGRVSLPAGQGMFFVFNDLAERTFWMKDMRFPLDIVWIRNDEVVGVSYDAMPEGPEPRNFYYSKLPVNRVLEINNGEAMKFNIKIGDKVKYNE